MKTSCSSEGRTGGWLLLLRRVEFDLQNKPLKKSPVHVFFSGKACVSLAIKTIFMAKLQFGPCVGE